MQEKKQKQFTSLRLTPKQVKAARVLLGWSQADLAERMNLSVHWVKRIERMPDTVQASFHSLNALIEEFNNNNIVFINDDNEISVKLLKK